jgi:hypothetical protein
MQDRPSNDLYFYKTTEQQTTQPCGIRLVRHRKFLRPGGHYNRIPTNCAPWFKMMTVIVKHPVFSWQGLKWGRALFWVERASDAATRALHRVAGDNAAWSDTAEMRKLHVVRTSSVNRYLGRKLEVNQYGKSKFMDNYSYTSCSFDVAIAVRSLQARKLTQGCCFAVRTLEIYCK